MAKISSGMTGRMLRRYEMRLLSGVVVSVAACSGPPATASGSPATAGAQTRSAAVGDTLHIDLGRSASVDEGRLTLTFLARGADSRCPANAVCVWMGDVAVRLAARARNTFIERELHTGIEPRSFTIDGYVVTLVGVLPYPGTETPEAPRAAPTALVRVTR
jgi:hypothetical protein